MAGWSADPGPSRSRRDPRSSARGCRGYRRSRCGVCSSSSSSFSRSSRCSSSSSTSSLEGPAASREVASTRLSRAGGADGTGLARGTQGPPCAAAASLWGRTALALRRRRGCGTGALLPPPFPFDLSHHEERGSSVARLAPFHPLRPHCFHVQPAEALRALRVREQPLLFEPLLSRHVHALYLAQWGEAHDEVQQPQAAA